MSKHVARWGLVFLLFLASFQGVLESGAASTVTTRLIDTKVTSGNILIDSQNNPHIFYDQTYLLEENNQQSTDLHQAFLTNQGWTKERLNYTDGNLFIIDTNSKPHIISTSNGTLKDTPLLDPDWNIRDFGIEAIAGYTLGLDSKGILHEITADQSYLEQNKSYVAHLYYTTWSKSGSSTQKIDEIDGSFDVRFHPRSIAVDSKGNLHVIFVQVQPSTNTLKYAKLTGSNWSIQTIAENAYNLDGVGRLILDSKDQPHLCYVHEKREYNPSDHHYFSSKSSLEYCYVEGSTWINRTIESKTDYEYYGEPTLRLDSNGDPRVYYFRERYEDLVNFDLHYAEWNGTAWDTDTIWTIQPDYGSAGVSPIAFDSYGNPQFVYRTVTATIHGAYRYGNLTYVAIDTSLTSSLATSSLILPAIVGGAIAIVIAVSLIVYRVNRKKAFNKAGIADPTPSQA